MEINNNGMTRVVFMTKNYVIKVPRFFGYSSFYGFWSSILTGWDANRTEYVWSKSETYSYMCKVKLSLFLSFIIVMPRLKPITEEEFSNFPRFDFKGYEHKQDSICKDKKNNYYIVDYGNC